MNFEDEQYVRLYTRKTITSKRLGWEGRTVLWHLMCEADRSGIIEVGDGDLAEALAVLLGDIPEEVIKVAIPRLASQGVTSRHGSKLLLVRFQEAQEAKRSDKVRAKECRDRRRAELVTPRDGSVTQSDDASRSVTVRHETSLSAVLCSAELGSAGVAPERSKPPAPTEQPKVFRTDAVGTRAVDPLRASFAAPGLVELHAFQAWATAFGKTGATYDTRRAACLAERVGAGMSAQDADDAIAGALADDYVTGAKTGKANNRLIFIFGDAERYEEFRDAGKALRERPSGTMRKSPSVRERIAAEEAAEARRRAERGIGPDDPSKRPVSDPAELNRLLESIG